MKTIVVQDDWQELLSFLPQGWLQLAQENGALKGLRKDKSPDSLLRTMLLHCACGYSLRETAVRAKVAGLADMSDVALMKRLKKCGPWFHAMCVALLRERGTVDVESAKLRFRVFDATHIKEPGQTGSQWRIHYSICLPEFECDSFAISDTKGKGCGESLQKFHINKGDHILADRGYCKGKGLEYVSNSEAFITVRLKPEGVILVDGNGDRFNLMEELGALTDTGMIGEWDIYIRGKDSQPVRGRICAMRKSEADAAQSRKKALCKASKKCQLIRESTLFYADYIILFTTFGKGHSAEAIFGYYRLRWQIELVFKRFKQLAGFGHLPKYDDESSKAWLYGKLFVALLTEKLLAYGGAISPWRAECAETDKEPLEGVCFYVPPTDGSDSAISRFTEHSFKLA
jgi:Transposase DDE domain.